MALFRPQRPPRRATVAAVLDIGSTKIVCLIARLTPVDGGEALRDRKRAIEVVGFSHQRVRGIKSGVVANLEAVEQSIRQAVDAAERRAGVTIGSLILNVSAGRLKSETCSASVALGGRAVSDADIGRVLAAGRAHVAEDGRTVIHTLPIGYSLDGISNLADPREMLGDRLGVDMHVATADALPVGNLELAVNRCHLSIAALVASSYASGLAVLVDDEAELGCAVVDLGGGTTTMAVFNRGRLIHVDAIAIGGKHITNDIARGLGTPLAEAERLKTMHGAVVATAGDERELLTVPSFAEDGHAMHEEVARAELTRIIRPRVDEILELTRDRLNASGFAGIVARRLVVTGGGSQLTGLVDEARRVIARNVRLGRPLGVAGLPQVARGPAFATAVGLTLYPDVAEMDIVDRGFAPALQLTGTGGGYFARVGRWLMESF
jgi:cell division protein FtsA